MCTAFVRRGKDIIAGFNMDINPGAFEYGIYANSKEFYVGLKSPLKSSAIIKIHGVNSNGNFANQLNNMDFYKAPYKESANSVSIDRIVDDYISNEITFDDIKVIADTKEITQIPNGAVNMPTIAFHSLIMDKEGRIMLLEPGNGYAVIKEKYAVLSNFSVLEIPNDLTDEKYGYYGKERYDIALECLKRSTDDFSVSEGLSILNKVKQVGSWATRVSFVYSRNENAVYYCVDGNFDDINKHSFEK